MSEQAVEPGLTADLDHGIPGDPEDLPAGDADGDEPDLVNNDDEDDD